MMFIMMLVGLGMVLGNLFSGRISGRYSPLRIAAMTNGVIVAVLLLIFAFGDTASWLRWCWRLSAAPGCFALAGAAANITVTKCQRRRNARGGGRADSV